MPFDHYRISQAGAAFNHGHKKRAAACGTSFYKSPSMGQTVNSLEPLTVSWDPSCMPDAKLIDMYLLAPGSETAPRLHIYKNIVASTGSYNATLMPRWWSATPSMLLQITMVDAGASLFPPKYPATTFTATYAEPATGKPEAADTSKVTANDGVTNAAMEVSGATSKSHVTKGGIAAAIIFPVLIAILVIYGYMRWSRAKGKEKRKKWNETIDKRMSTISTDWKSITPAGAAEAIRNSMAIGENYPGNRHSSFSFGAIRPSSIVGEGGHAGIGARSLYANTDNKVQMSQTSLNSQPSHIRPGFRQSAFENRVSRVSFAADTRPSGESRRTRNIPSEYIPPLPNVNTAVTRGNVAYRPGSSFVNGDRASSYYEDNAEAYDVGSMSPRQTQGAPALSPDDIRSRIGGSDAVQGRPSFDEVLPALSMMRTTGDKNDEGSFYQAPSPPAPIHTKSITSPSSTTSLTSPDYFNGAAANPAQYVNAPPSATLFSSSPLSPGYPLPTSPASAATPTTTSPYTQNFGGMQSFGGMMQPMPANVMSPDDMLKAYAARSAALSAATPASTPASTTSNRMSYLGNGVGFGATVTTPSGAAVPTGAGTRRSLVPAGPGAISPSRGAYGVTYDETEEWGEAK